jgi:ribosomal protein S8E
MSDKTQTAVEWLVQQLSNSRYFYSIMEEIESRSTIVQPNSILHQAIEMEKQQIMSAYVTNLPIQDGVINAVQKAEQYYTDIYKP